ncbi:hypothetical protein [Actinoplanes sp. SE50]|nr:hypothetical protein [Actinoplanes sp. SE50]
MGEAAFRAVMLHGGTALGTGHGEAVSPILARPTTSHRPPHRP